MSTLLDLLGAWEAVDHADSERRTLLAAEILAAAGTQQTSTNAAHWQRYLNLTGDHRFLASLPSRADRSQWAETANAAILRSGYTLLDMFQRSVRRAPDRALFQVMSQSPPGQYTYAHVARRLRQLAATFLRLEKEPRVALLCNNGLESACCDLACLFYGILIAPLNVHFDAETIAWVCAELDINIVVVDSPESWQRLESVRAKLGRKLHLLAVRPLAASSGFTGRRLQEELLEVTPAETEELLAQRKCRPLEEVATVMFTSGSTGKPKGISFSEMALVSKRFCRAAALPHVGEYEVQVCFLPLFHTFGRYLEMLGTVYWTGTYVFAGNPSAETLLSLFAQVQPTGLISIPLRWQQIRDRAQERLRDLSGTEGKEEAFRAIVGQRLHWGLSAAGYLAPQTFRFFNQHGVRLNSGFGMTEATGGITMTPAGEYRDNSIGIPLPGIRVRRTEQGEMEMTGPYVARYLDEKGPGDQIPALPEPGAEHWLATGDLFRELPDGHLEIVDRLKDIYKNNRGQTVAPRKIEKRFEGVPGIKRTFLVGDARAYNVLLIVTDPTDPVMAGLRDPAEMEEYCGQLVATANQDLAPYERVISFTVLDRDFSIDLGELTPKGSYRRSAIEENLSGLIDSLYKDRQILHQVGNYEIRIPRWIFRDLGILESDLAADRSGLTDAFRKRRLPIGDCDLTGWVQIGDLAYQVQGNCLDLGILARQPGLWLGNLALVRFCPCREGWDTPAEAFSPRVRLVPGLETQIREPEHGEGAIRYPRLVEVDNTVAQALFGRNEAACDAIRGLADRLPNLDERLSHVLRYRLEALAYHPEFVVRTTAYQALLLDEPDKDYSRSFPAFVDSGLPFLDDEAIESLAAMSLDRRRLEALRQRLANYRAQLVWPAAETTRRQFEDVLRLLRDFGRDHAKFYDVIRAELACWILHRDDPGLAEFAERCLFELAERFEENLRPHAPILPDEDWARIIVFSDEVGQEERDPIRRVLSDPTFIQQSLLLAFDEAGFNTNQLPPEGVWVTKILSRRTSQRYRVSVNTTGGKHFDMQLIVNEDVMQEEVLRTIFWGMAMSNPARGARVLPRLGYSRPDLSARSMQYLGDLTLWEKVRELSSPRALGTSLPNGDAWRKRFVRGLMPFFRVWRISQEQMVPGRITPENVVVPERDFQEGATLASVTGWRQYQDPLSLLAPMVINFFRRTSALYPWATELLDPSWIFDAAVNELGIEAARAFLIDARPLLDPPAPFAGATELGLALDAFLERLNGRWYAPLPVENAIERYDDWLEATPNATPTARGQLVGELLRLYRLDRFGELGRYYLYRHTFFRDIGEESERVFDSLLQRMFQHPQTPALQMIQVPELQATIADPDSRRVFGRLIFPRATQPQKLEVQAVGEAEEKHVILTSQISDRLGESYVLRDPIEPAEIGQLYRQYFQAGYPKTISEQDRFLVLLDRDEQIVGGLCYRFEPDGVVHLDGTTIQPFLANRGLGTKMLEDFCSRMENAGIHVVKTHFYLRGFYARGGFEVDERWGALVRFLHPEGDEAM